jgi:hypothetical protein
MPRRFRNRKAFEINDYLENHEFYIQPTKGDDRIYVRKGYLYAIKTPDRKNEGIPNGTMDYILKSIGKCGIKDPKKDVLNWWIENGYGD